MLTGAGPFAEADGHDFPGSVHEIVPGAAAGVEDGLVVGEDPVGEPRLAKVLPDVLNRIEFGRLGRQGYQRDVGRRREPVGGVPSGLVGEEDGVGATARPISARCRAMPSVSARGRTSAAPSPRSGQMAPNR